MRDPCGLSWCSFYVINSLLVFSQIGCVDLLGHCFVVWFPAVLLCLAIVGELVLTVCVLYSFLKVLYVGLRSVIVVFPVILTFCCCSWWWCFCRRQHR